jgi:predicted phosphohydrolase
MPVKIFYASDLHLEHEDFNDPSSPFYIYSNPEMAMIYSKSYLVLAGDICQIFEKEKFKKFFDIISPKFKCIIYVTGNHEYHRITYSDLLINQTLFPYHNVYFLQNDFIEFPDDGIRFYGTTLWTRIDANPVNNKVAEKFGSDFKSIKNHEPLELHKSAFITRNGTARLFEKQFANLKNDLSILSNLKTIVITHHPPISEINDSWLINKIKTIPIASLYVSDLKSEIEYLNFDYWIFGHSHSTQYSELQLKNNNKAKFISNPYGNGTNYDFNLDSFIEI